MKAVNSIARLASEETDISAVEYAIMLSLIGSGLLASVMGLGSQMSTNINNASAILKG